MRSLLQRSGIVLARGGVIYKISQKIEKKYVNAKWKSLQKTFKAVGCKSGVTQVPKVIGPECVSIGNGVSFGDDVRLEAWKAYGESCYSPNIVIGDNVVITDRVYVSCIDSVTIGDDVLIGRDVFITDNSHGRVSSTELRMKPVERPLYSKGPIAIGRNVWIGRGVTILAGVTIGSGAVIGAHSLVNKDIPANAVVVGCPAKVIKMLG